MWNTCGSTLTSCPTDLGPVSRSLEAAGSERGSEQNFLGWSALPALPLGTWPHTLGPHGRCLTPRGVTTFCEVMSTTGMLGLGVRGHVFLGSLHLHDISNRGQHLRRLSGGSNQDPKNLNQ